MTGPARDVAELVAALLRALPAADLAALAEGRARLAVVPVDATPPAAPAGLLAPAGNPATDGTTPATALPDPATPATALPDPATPATALPDRGAPATASSDRITRAGRPGTTAAAPARLPARRAAPAPEPAEARAALAAMARRDDGTAYLSGWTARDLRVLAASLELRGVAGLRKADLVGRIVDRTIGYRLDSAAIRRL
ncbi:hypothetical protein AB0J85_15150 [Micromonospora echinofusca]|uniref:hypothetical protein n=1 Tax=Micromonospora echinofusca TaxID=47858 RepID=UPI003433B898